MGNTSDQIASEQGPFEPIAIVGMSCILPDSPDIESFWKNVLQAHVSIKDVPNSRWNADDFFDPEGVPGKVAENKTYSKIGAFVEDFEFNWRRWKQPPGTLPQIDVCQLWAVETSAEALAHAGYGDGGKPFDRSSTGVIFANALGGEIRAHATLRIHGDQAVRIANESGQIDSEAFLSQWNDGLPKIDEDTMPGELANVVAGRVANLLDLQGPNYTTDAACASSMAALVDACRQLQSRQINMAVCGASDRTMDAATYAKFSAIGALSSSHSTPFDARANGFVMGEGAGVMVLKRLQDAIDDGDQIYSVVRGVGASSDGRGKGITAPSQRGQLQAISRAYAQAGYEPATVKLVEAHGTSTRVGDATELGSLNQIFSNLGSGDKVAVGSIKSQIGHLKAAAGMAGMLKTTLALHNGIIPPSAGFVTPNENVDWTTNPFYVPTQSKDWSHTDNQIPRRAGVSAFGFGGTNFHVTMEEYVESYHGDLAKKWTQSHQAALSVLNGEQLIPSGGLNEAPSILDSSARPTMTHAELMEIEGGLLLLSGKDVRTVIAKLSQIEIPSNNFDNDPCGIRLSVSFLETNATFNSQDLFRVAIVCRSWNEFQKKKTMAIDGLEDEKKWGFMQAQGILVSNQPPLPPKARTAHMYPGQGSQYVGMTYDLSKRFKPVMDIWKKADITMSDVLNGETISSFVLRDNLSESEKISVEQKLKQTEYTQPAMLTADLAIERLLNAYGYQPDMVAGHSLGEYGALMSSGILDMDGALRAAAARGTEMGSVEIEDKGLMASVTAPYQKVKEIIGSIDGYVIAANKNSPKMTVIAGKTEPVKQAMSLFEKEGFQSVQLATSHAFHSEIVAPANEPLYRFLSSLDIQWPNIPITSNVDGQFYPNSGEDAKSSVLEKLAPQMASPVEWTKQIQTMYDAGARVFLEVGPKRALTVFASQILEENPHLALNTNHPKQGGITSFLTSVGALALAGRLPNEPGLDSDVFSEAFRAGPIEAHKQALNSEKSTQPTENSQSVSPHVSLEVAKTRFVQSVIGKYSHYPSSFCHGQVDLVEGLGLTSNHVHQVISEIKRTSDVNLDAEPAKFTTPHDFVVWVQNPPSEFFNDAVSRTQSYENPSPTRSVQVKQESALVVTGVSLGLPGGEKVFDSNVFERLVNGETCISEVSDEYKQRLLDKNIVRLIKGRDGSVNMEPAEIFGDIPQLAGIKSEFDLNGEFGVEEKIMSAWDITTQLACASGLLALRDAGIPLTPVEQVGKGGLRLIRSWEIPSIYRDRTGVIFSSCFPGLQQAFSMAGKNGADENGNFDRGFLFKVLNMGHSQFSQYVGIRGPNTTINLACASATAAFSVAEDWITMGRCDRVIIISADDVTGDDLWDWIGSGFAASGAAATGNVVEEVALPFDKRRNGLVLGMGAAAFVIEKEEDAMERGVQGICQILGTRIANSAFHGTRLDVDHVAETFDQFMTEMEDRHQLNRHEIAPKTVFFSHETYTPARGGSAQAEVAALRKTFTESTDKLVIANTKGFTGHPMGVGIEDASMIYGMLTNRIPPIANFKEKDESLGSLNLSKGGEYPELQYAIRFGAGFGSQIALSMLRKLPISNPRISEQKLLSWNQNQAKTKDVQFRILQQKLVAYVDVDENLHGGIAGDAYDFSTQTASSILTENTTEKKTIIEEKPQVETPSIQEIVVEPQTSVPKMPMNSSNQGLIAKVVEVVVKHTGYPADFVELDQDLEGELGIDTVKQAEIMADIRDVFSLPVDESFILSEYPTLNHMIMYIENMLQGNSSGPAIVEETSQVEAPHEMNVPIEVEHEQVSLLEIHGDSKVIGDALIEVVVKHTGYPEDFIELDQDLEGELGIDTVKQAEIMSDIRDLFSLPVDENFILSEHPTLNHFIAYVDKMQNPSQKVTHVEASTTKSEPLAKPEPSLSKAMPEHKSRETVSNVTSEARDKLVGVVVKHTGYPEDFIELDQDLEGELGIDTVKQAEIMGDVREIFSLPVDESFVLSEHPTLNHFLDYIAKMRGEETVAEEVTEETSVTESKLDVSNNMQGCRRWQVEIEACPGTNAPLTVNGTVVLTIDEWGISDSMTDLLRERGFDVIRIGLEPGAKKVSWQEESTSSVCRLDPGNEEQLASLSERFENVCGLIHLAPLQLTSETWSNDLIPSQQLMFSAHSFFGLLKSLDSSLSNKDGFVVSVTALDGRHGNHAERFNSLACAASGVTKSYAFEQPHLRCRAFDLHPELILDSASTAKLLLDDLFGLGGDVEIGIDKDHRRWTMVCFAEDLGKETTPLGSDDIWVVSGGGSGVTASSIVGLSDANKNAKATFILLGRSNLIPETEHWLKFTQEELDEKRMILREELVEQSPDGKVTMVQWNRAWQKRIRSLDIRKTIQSIEKSGNNAEYHVADVMDKLAISTAINKRKVTGIVHGAGLEDSKLVSDKTWETFDKVTRVKVDGLRALIDACDELPSVVCAFTSVAGRFGNGGQTDYAAANSVLDAEMARISARGDSRGIAIGWTGWRDVGMATRGSIESVFAAAGIETLDVSEGVSCFVDEVMRGGKRRVLVCGSLGLMDKFQSFREKPLKLPPKMASMMDDASRFPFIDKILLSEDGKTLHSQCTLSVADYPFLSDHAIEGVPYHPGVMAMEMFAQNALLLCPGSSIAGFQNIEFGLPIKLMKGALVVRIESTIQTKSGNAIFVKSRIVSDLVNSRGEIFGEPRIHHTGVVRLIKSGENVSQFLEKEIKEMPAVGLPIDEELLEHPSFIYLRYFHGPRFQSHGGVLKGVGDLENPGLDGIALMRHQLPNSELFAQEASGEAILLESLPMIFEAAFQNSGLLGMEFFKFSSLPVGIEWSTILRVPEKGEKLRLRSLLINQDENGVATYNVTVFGEDDSPVVALKNLKLKSMAPIPESQQFTFKR